MHSFDTPLQLDDDDATTETETSASDQDDAHFPRGPRHL
jgi:hypothetical protein